MPMDGRRRSRVRRELGRHDDGDDAAERAADDRVVRGDPARRRGCPEGVPVAVFTLVYLRVWAATGCPVYWPPLLMTGRTRPFGYGVAVIVVAAGASSCRRSSGCVSGRAAVRSDSSWATGALAGAAVWRSAGPCDVLPRVLLGSDGRVRRRRGDGAPWVLLITAAVAAEKLLPGGKWISRTTGVAL